MASSADKPTKPFLVPPRAKAESVDEKNVIDLSNLKVAWSRLKADRKGRCFVEHPHLLEWIESDLEGWLRDVEASIKDPGYPAHESVMCYVPKPGWLIRPGAALDLRDEVVLNAVLGKCHEQIYKSIGKHQGNPDVAYQLKKPSEGVEWIKSAYQSWTEFRDKSLELLSGTYSFVVFADVAGFYDNIDLGILLSELNALNVDPQVFKVLSTCLYRWSKPRGKGIPQGYTGSDILAKVYMHPVDRALQNAGLPHLRYVDDIRIFCRNSLEAKLAINLLTDALRTRGLILQSAKTKILPAEAARAVVDGVRPIIESLLKQMNEEATKVKFEDYGYPGSEKNAAEESSTNDQEPVVLERAFQDRFLVDEKNHFDKSLFHYLLRRLGKSKSRIALNYCISLLRNRPEETVEVLAYFKEIVLLPAEKEIVLQFLASKDALYDYQNYVIVRWFYENGDLPKSLIKQCRRWAFDMNRQPWLRTYSLAVIGKNQDPADIDAIQNRYSSASSDLERAEVVAALRKVEIRRRNGFYAQVKNDCDLVSRAVKVSMQSSA